MVNLTKPKRKLVIGDIHGALKALKQVLEKCSYNPEEDQLIFLGDYVDGYPESAQTIDYLIELKEKANFKPIFLIGNHDVWLLEWLVNGNMKLIWLSQGGSSTLASYDELFNFTKNYKYSKKEHKNFFKNSKPYYIDEDNNVFVHAGFINPDLSKEEISVLTWDRKLFEIAFNSDKLYKETGKLPKILELFNKVFIGHTTTEIHKVKFGYPEYKNDKNNLNKPITVPIKRCNLINMDTGAGYSGKLSIMDINTEEFWQSDYTKNLYKREIL